MNWFRIGYNIVICFIFVGVTVPALGALELSDEELVERVLEVGDAIDYPDADTVTIFTDTTITIEIGAWDIQQSHTCIKLLTDNAVRSHSSITSGLSENHTEHSFDSVRIIHPDGSITNLPTDHTVITPTPSYGIYQKGKRIVLPLPTLEVGDALEVKTTRKQCWLNCMIAPEMREQGNLQNYWQYFGWFNPRAHGYVLEKRLTILTPRSLPLQFKAYNGGVQAGMYIDDPQYFRYVFEAHELEQISELEPHTRNRGDFDPYIKITSIPDWESKSVWYYWATKPQREPTPEMIHQVEELTEDCESDDEIILTLSNWLGDHIRYGSAFWDAIPEGYVGHPAGMTFRDRLGVCKDIALLFATMLDVVGIESYVALTAVNNPMDIFPDESVNHAITILKSSDGSYIAYDPTNTTFTPVQMHVLEQEQGYIAAVESGDPIRRTRIQSYTDHSIVLDAETHLDLNGTARCSLTYHLTGFPDGHIRSYLRRHNRNEIQQYFEEWVKYIAPQAELTRYAFSDPRDYTRDSTVELTCTIPFYGIPTGSGLLVVPPSSRYPIPQGSMRDPLYYTELEKRTTEMNVGATWQVILSEKILLPNEYSLQDPTIETNFEDERSAFRYHRFFVPEERRIQLEEQVIIKRKIITPETYPTFRKGATEAIRLMDTPLLIKENQLDTTTPSTSESEQGATNHE
jgi:hypothetical protein